MDKNDIPIMGPPDGGLYTIRTEFPYIFNAFFNIFNLKMLKFDKIELTKIEDLCNNWGNLPINKRFEICNNFKQKVDNDFPYTITNKTNCQGCEPYYPVFIYLQENNKFEYLFCKDTEEYKNSAPATEVYTPDNKLFCLHTWLARFYNDTNYRGNLGINQNVVINNFERINYFYNKAGENISHNDLTSFGLKFETDKSYWHQYTDTYFKYFSKKRFNENTILEIGIGTEMAPSIKMLSSFFDNSTIYAIDIKNEVISQANKIKNVKAHFCDSSNKNDLSKLFGSKKFDIIIDDGSHIDWHQKNAFEYLFPLIKDGGVFICEDIHTSGPIDNNSMIHYLQNHKYSEMYKSTEIYHRNQIALRCYSCKIENINKNSICSCGINLSPLKNDSISFIIQK